MKRILYAVVLSISTMNLIAQSFSGPESVEYDPLNNRYIVSNTTSGNLQSVVPGNAPNLFVSGVSAPYGLVVVDSTVYVNTSGMVKGYNLVTGSLTFTSNVN